MCLKLRSRFNVSLRRHIPQAVQGNHLDICRIKNQEPDAHERDLTGNLPSTSLRRNSVQEPGPMNSILQRTFPKPRRENLRTNSYQPPKTVSSRCWDRKQCHHLFAQRPNPQVRTIFWGLFPPPTPRPSDAHFVGRNQLCLACHLVFVISVSANAPRHTKTIWKHIQGPSQPGRHLLILLIFYGTKTFYESLRRRTFP